MADMAHRFTICSHINDIGDRAMMGDYIYVIAVWGWVVVCWAVLVVCWWVAYFWLFNVCWLVWLVMRHVWIWVIIPLVVRKSVLQLLGGVYLHSCIVEIAGLVVIHGLLTFYILIYR